VSYVPKSPSHYRNNDKERLVLRDINNFGNAYEGTLIYTPPAAGASTFYFPVGARDARFTNKDHVITIFKDLVWIKVATRALVGDPVHPYTRAANVSID